MEPTHSMPLDKEPCLDLDINDEFENSSSALNLVGRLLTDKNINHKAITVVLTSAWNLG